MYKIKLKATFEEKFNSLKLRYIKFRRVKTVHYKYYFRKKKKIQERIQKIKKKNFEIAFSLKSLDLNTI